MAEEFEVISAAGNREERTSADAEVPTLAELFENEAVLASGINSPPPSSVDKDNTPLLSEAESICSVEFLDSDSSEEEAQETEHRSSDELEVEVLLWLAAFSVPLILANALIIGCLFDRLVFRSRPAPIPTTLPVVYVPRSMQMHIHIPSQPTISSRVLHVVFNPLEAAWQCQIVQTYIVEQAQKSSSWLQYPQRLFSFLDKTFASAIAWLFNTPLLRHLNA